jgi:hypothetical protein
MADPDLLQLLAREAVTFFEFVGDSIGDPQARAALIKDLGGNPATARDNDPFPASNLDAIKAYRDAADPTAEAGAQMLADVAVLLDFVGSQVETWGVSAEAGAQELAHSLLDLLATNYVRVRFPRLFMVLQAVALVEDITSTYGEGSNNGMRLVDAVKALFGYLLQPSTSLQRLGAAATPPSDVVRVSDLGARVTAAVLGGFAKKKQEEGRLWGITDVYTGWDAPGLDLDPSASPATADLVSTGMSSFAFGDETSGLSTQTSAAGRLFVTVALVPESHGGTSVFLALGGSADIEQPVGERWTLSVKAAVDAGVAVLLPSRFQLADPDSGAFSASLGLASKTDDATGLSFSLPSASGSRLEVGQLAVAFTLATSSGGEALLTIADSALVVDPGDQDGFVAELLGHTPLRLAFSAAVGYSSSRGLVLEGTGSPAGTPAQPAPLTGPGTVGPPVLAVTIPVGRAYGPLTVHEVGVRITRGPAGAAAEDVTQHTFEVDTSVSAQLGPVYLRLDQLGLLFRLDDSMPPEQRNLRFVDLSLGAKAPRGVAVQVDTAMVTGGGSILHDPDQGIYFGTFDLAFRGSLVLKAIALIATRNADGSKGFSLLVIVTAEFADYPLGMGFFLQGLGGMLAVNHTFDETAMRAALPTGQLRNVLFPSDPVHHTTEVLHSLQSLFPVRPGSYMFGLLAKIGWSRPTLVQFELGVIYEWGHQHRLIILGQVSAILPRRDNAVLRLNMDALGLIDFDAGTFALDATLYDSRLSGRFVLSGAMAMRMAWHGSAGFALAVGGLHPRFTAPAGFPNVARLQLALTNGDNPKLICQSYFAITSNTVQFGADCSLYAAAFGFSIEGDVGYDVLIQPLPFHFVADFRASVQLKRGSHNVFKVSVQGELEGPLPLRLSGKASFEILWCDFSVSFTTTLVDGGVPNDLVLVDVLTVLLGALGDPRAWHAELPPTTGQLVATRAAADDSVSLHPLGTLTVRQNVVPLNLTRDIDRVGTGTPSGSRRFAITQAALGSSTQQATGVQELFAPAQYFDMSDDDKLAAPSFEAMDAGVVLGADGYTFDFGARVASPFTYTDIAVGPGGVPVTHDDPHGESGERVLALTMLSAASGAATRRTLTWRFEAPVHPLAPTVTPRGWAAVASDGGAAVRTPTWAEARGHVLAASDPSTWVIVPGSEMVST